MTTYSARRTIQAKPDVIWGLLTDASSYADWNPSVIGIEGTIAPGERIRLTSTVKPKRAFRLTVREFSPPHTMVWADGLPRGLFKGVRTYTLTPEADDTTQFSMDEIFSGLLEPLISRSIPGLSESFEQFADGLKTAAETK